MKREPKIVKAPNGLWNVMTSDLVGGYWLGRCYLDGWVKTHEQTDRRCGVFDSRSYAAAALSKAPPVPADAVWDDDCVDVEAEDAAALAHQKAAIEPIVARHQETLDALAKVADELSKVVHSSPNPTPSMEWKPIAETLDELRAMGESPVDIAWPDETYISSWPASKVVSEFGVDVCLRVAHWTIIPRPKPTPTLAELERAVAEAVDAMKRHGVYAKGSLEDVLITRHDALLAHRERANNSGDAAGVKG